MKTYIAKRELAPTYNAEYRVKAESKEEALAKIRKITGEYAIKVVEA